MLIRLPWWSGLIVLPYTRINAAKWAGMTVDLLWVMRHGQLYNVRGIWDIKKKCWMGGLIPPGIVPLMKIGS